MPLTVAKVEQLEKTTGQIEAMYAELSALAKKVPNEALNKFKVKLLNQALEAANAILESDYCPIAGFEQFDETAIPSASDAVFVLSQYMGELERKRSDNIYMDIGRWYYRLDPNDSASKTNRGIKVEISTAPPRKIGKK